MQICFTVQHLYVNIAYMQFLHLLKYKVVGILCLRQGRCPTHSLSTFIKKKNETAFILSRDFGIIPEEGRLYDHLLLQKRSNGRNEKTI